jgi:hypothetical protein
LAREKKVFKKSLPNQAGSFPLHGLGQALKNSHPLQAIACFRLTLIVEMPH